jgi:hypothetical protein
MSDEQRRHGSKDRRKKMAAPKSGQVQGGNAPGRAKRRAGRGPANAALQQYAEVPPRHKTENITIPNKIPRKRW